MTISMLHQACYLVALVIFLGGSSFTRAQSVPPSTALPPGVSPQQALDAIAASYNQDIIINADIWNPEPMIMSANLGFLSIIGINTTDAESIRAAGGTYNDNVTCDNGQAPPFSSLTSASSSQQIGFVGYACAPQAYGGLPVCFSMPVRPSTIKPEAFRVTLTNGTTFLAPCAGITPNIEYNERHCVVLFADFGTRVPSSDPGSVYPTSIEIVSDLELIGPAGQPISAVGLKYTNATNPYNIGNGPKFLATRISKLTDLGEGIFAPPIVSQASYPNSGIDLYGKGEDLYRVRLYYSGGMTPDGVSLLFPGDYETYFSLLAKTYGNDGEEGEKGEIELSSTNKEYDLGRGNRVKVLGLADLGPFQETYDACYSIDKDNYIDIIVQASSVEAAAAIQTFKAKGGLYNPGGPGTTPTPGLIWSQPSPTQTLAIDNALVDAKTVTYCLDQMTGLYSNDAALCTALYAAAPAPVPAPFDGDAPSGAPALAPMSLDVPTPPSSAIGTTITHHIINSVSVFVLLLFIFSDLV